MTPAIMSIYIGRHPPRSFNVRGDDIASIGMELAKQMPTLQQEGGRVAITLTRGNLIHIVKVSR